MCRRSSWKARDFSTVCGVRSLESRRLRDDLPREGSTGDCQVWHRPPSRSPQCEQRKARGDHRRRRVAHFSCEANAHIGEDGKS